MSTPDATELSPSDTSDSGSEDRDEGLDRTQTIADLSASLDYEFVEQPLAELATRHRSWCTEHGGVESNERLEFLGDAVLGLVMAEHLYRGDPDVAEGVLARRRAELVNARALAEVAEEIGLGGAIRLGRGEDATGGRTKPSILADCMEAVLGAVYLDGGIDAARRVILSLFGEKIAHVVASAEGTDYKSRLQEVVARLHDELPRYELVGTGPDHDRRFRAVVWIGDEPVGHGEGRSKKLAEQAAAREAWQTMSEATTAWPENGVGDA